MTPGRHAAEASDMGRPNRAREVARLGYAMVAWVFLGCVLVQAYLVGVDVFSGGDGATHRDFAYLYGWLTPVLVLLAAAAQLPTGTRALTILLLVLYAVQTVLPSQKEAYPLLAALHTPNALAIFAIAIVLARRAPALSAWREVFGRTGGGRHRA
jgi:hypothetical protein